MAAAAGVVSYVVNNPNEVIARVDQAVKVGRELHNGARSIARRVKSWFNPHPPTPDAVYALTTLISSMAKYVGREPPEMSSAPTNANFVTLFGHLTTFTDAVLARKDELIRLAVSAAPAHPDGALGLAPGASQVSCVLGKVASETKVMMHKDLAGMGTEDADQLALPQGSKTPGVVSLKEGSRSAIRKVASVMSDSRPSRTSRVSSGVSPDALYAFVKPTSSVQLSGPVLAADRPAGSASYIPCPRASSAPGVLRGFGVSLTTDTQLPILTDFGIVPTSITGGTSPASVSMEDYDVGADGLPGFPLVTIDGQPAQPGLAFRVPGGYDYQAGTMVALHSRSMINSDSHDPRDMETNGVARAVRFLAPRGTPGGSAEWTGQLQVELNPGFNCDAGTLTEDPNVSATITIFAFGRWWSRTEASSVNTWGMVAASTFDNIRPGTFTIPFRVIPGLSNYFAFVSFHRIVGGVASSTAVANVLIGDRRGAQVLSAELSLSYTATTSYYFKDYVVSTVGLDGVPRIAEVSEFPNSWQALCVGTTSSVILSTKSAFLLYSELPLDAVDIAYHACFPDSEENDNPFADLLIGIRKPMANGVPRNGAWFASTLSACLAVVNEGIVHAA